MMAHCDVIRSSSAKETSKKRQRRKKRNISNKCIMQSVCAARIIIMQNRAALRKRHSRSAIYLIVIHPLFLDSTQMRVSCDLTISYALDHLHFKWVVSRIRPPSPSSSVRSPDLVAHVYRTWSCPAHTHKQLKDDELAQKGESIQNLVERRRPVGRVIFFFFFHIVHDYGVWCLVCLGLRAHSGHPALTSSPLSASTNDIPSSASASSSSAWLGWIEKIELSQASFICWKTFDSLAKSQKWNSITAMGAAGRQHNLNIIQFQKYAQTISQFGTIFYLYTNECLFTSLIMAFAWISLLDGMGRVYSTVCPHFACWLF